MSALLPAIASANEVIATFGGGPQPGEDQEHRSAGVDISFFRFERSARQHIQLGISYTAVEADVDQNDRLWAASIYPQLSLYPAATGWFRRIFPDYASPYFFVRALGPSYISARKLGNQEQGTNFAFQAQLGLGLTLDKVGPRGSIVAISWKHFSNAGLFEENDGIDLPLVLSLGMKF
jgi:hypothetical protein